MEAEMRELVFVTLTAAAMALSSAASAQLLDMKRLCLGGSEVPIEQKLSACTATIESGQETPQYRAVALERRGLALFAKKDYDRAIADYDQAVGLNPN
jgi:tetratricopeptide (TPR) repeat protein